jgi:hypothetical protein
MTWKQDTSVEAVEHIGLPELYNYLPLSRTSHTPAAEKRVELTQKVFIPNHLS